MNRRKISWGLARFYKIVLPAIVIVLFGVVVIIQRIQGFDPTLSLIFGSFFLFVYHLSTRSLHEVEIDDQFLYWVDSQQNVRIPFSEIESVKDKSTGRFFRCVQIKLKTPSVLGQTIDFIAINGMDYDLFKPHPIVKELAKLAHLPEIEKQN